MSPTDFLFWLTVATVTVLSSARFTRLITQDSYPPVAWARSKWIRATHGGKWAELATCPYCAAPYITFAIIGWGVLTDFHDGAWWFVNAVMGAAYAAAIVVVRDGE